MYLNKKIKLVKREEEIDFNYIYNIWLNSDFRLNKFKIEIPLECVDFNDEVIIEDLEYCISKINRDEDLDLFVEEELINAFYVNYTIDYDEDDNPKVVKRVNNKINYKYQPNIYLSLI